jgi:glycosyltransferase involved in cell wall biosynthesis
MKYLIIVNASKTVITFRTPLIKRLIESGDEVFLTAMDNQYSAQISDLGCSFSFFPYSNRSLNLHKTLAYQRFLVHLIAKVQPDIILTFMAKPNTFGPICAKKAKSKALVFSMVEGLGDPFTLKTFKWKCIRFEEIRLYRRAFRNVTHVFFLNRDDQDLFVNLHIISKEKGVVVPGVGVDIQRFNVTPFPDLPVVGMACRLLKTKGVLEYCEAARECKKSNPAISFLLAGPYGTIHPEDLSPYINDGSVNYIGTLDDMVSFYQKILIFCYPSYREGMPMSIMEAMSCGRTVVATDTVGCRDLIKNEQTGLLIPAEDSHALACAIQRLINDHDLCLKLSQTGRAFVVGRYDSETACSAYLDVVKADYEKFSSRE